MHPKSAESELEEDKDISQLETKKTEILKICSLDFIMTSIGTENKMKN